MVEFSGKRGYIIAPGVEIGRQYGTFEYIESKEDYKSIGVRLTAIEETFKKSINHIYQTERETNHLSILFLTQHIKLNDLFKENQTIVWRT